MNLPVNNKSISVVIPVFNSEGSLADLVARLEKVLTSLAVDFEAVFVNDGSIDNSLKVLKDLEKNYAWVTYLDLMRNYGQHNAVLCGIRAAKNEIIVTMDDDLQHPPEEIPKLLDKMSEGYDVVYGVPEKEQHGILRDIASQFTKLALQSSMGVDIARNVSAFRAFYTYVRDAFANYQSPFLSIDVLLTWGTTRFSAIPVKHNPREIGVSNYTFRKLITHAINMMTGFSTLPLQVASLLGFVLTFFGFGILLYVIIRFFIQGSSVPGFPFLASIIAIFSGAQLFALGIIGEYLARMHFRSMEKPAYVIRNSILDNVAEKERST